jgi:hypothetical protein
MNRDPIFKPNYKKQNKRVELGKAKKNQNPDSYRDKAAERLFLSLPPTQGRDFRYAST